MSTTAPTSTERRTGTAAAARARPPRRSGRPARDPKGGARRGDGLERLRILLAGTMGAILAGYTCMVPLAAALTASGGVAVSPDGALATAVPLWLAAHQIPLVIDGRPLGVLPLLPTILVFAVVLVASGWSVRRLGGRVRHDAGAVVASQAGAAAAVAVLGGALLPADMAVTAPWASMVGAVLVAGTAAAAGVLRACGPPAAWRERLRGWPMAGLAGARTAVAGLALSGALVLLAGLLGRAPEVARSFATLAPGAGAGAGVALLALAYLPNALLGGMAWALGPGLGIGAARSGPFGIVDGPLPPFPLFAAFPAAPAPAWAVLVLLLPLGAGVAAGAVCARALGPAAGRAERLAAAGTAAGVTALGAAVAAAVAGGRLGAGPYDPVTLSGWLVLPAVLLLVGVPAAVVCAGLGRSSAGAAGALAVARARRTARAGAGRPGPGRAGVGSSAAGRPGRPGAGRAGSARGGRADPANEQEDGEPAVRRGRAGRTGRSRTTAQADRDGEPAGPGRRRTIGRDDPGSAAGGPSRGAGTREPRPEEDGDTPSGSAAGEGHEAHDDHDDHDVAEAHGAPEAHDDPPRTVADLVARRERESPDPSPATD